jgi:hypothetical protein
MSVNVAPRRLLLGVFIVLAAVLLSTGYKRWKDAPASHIDVYDGFEGPSLTAVWSNDRFEPGAVSMQSDVVRTGHGAVKIVLRSRDKFEAGIKGSKDSERAELLEASRLVSREDATYEYSFSDFLPADFPIVPIRLVLAQWKQDCNGHEPCNDDGPVVALRYVAGVIRITRQEGRRQVTLFEAAQDLRGKWTAFRFRLRFTPRQSGVIQAWIDGRPVVDYQGATAYAENDATGYANPSKFYFKMGLYRDVMEQPMTIYLDEYRKKQL